MLPFLTLLMLCPVAAWAQESDSLFAAIRRDDASAVEALLHQGADPNARNPEGATALMYAAIHAGAPLMELLISEGADPNGQNPAGATALMWAAGDAAKAKVLVIEGADVNAISKLGRTPLMIASATAGNLETVRLLLAKGANPSLVDENGDGPVGDAASAGDPAMLRELLTRGGSTSEKVRSGGNFRGFTPLMRAAQVGCVECVRVLLEHGAEANPISDAPRSIQAGAQSLGKLTPLLIAAPQGNTELVRVLLDHHAPVDARDARGLTPLMLAVTSESQSLEVVRLLAARGAAADVRSDDGQTALSWSQKWGAGTEISRFLLEHGAKASLAEPSTVPPPPSGRNAREAAGRAISLLQSSETTYFKKSGCAGCHHQLLTALLLGAAREHGLPTDEAFATALLKTLIATKQPVREQLFQRVSQGISPIETSLFLIALASLGSPPDVLTDALCHDLAGTQRLDGSWAAMGQRPPITYSRVSATAYAVRALQLCASRGRRVEMERRIARARDWLSAAQPAHTEERVMRLLGLFWSSPNATLEGPRVKALVQLQQPDGGWAQRAGFSSDAYATGQALYALQIAGGLSTSDPVFRSGLEFLLRTQHEDGSWFVRSRSVKFQPYFESGFPYGDDQWISAAATNWAALALTSATGK
jgi:ankyrin repeat protein